MRTTWLVVCGVAVGACGRVGFDARGDDDARVDDGGVRGDDGALGDGGTTTSCAGLAATCGPAGTSPCCGSPLVPGGTYFRSFDNGADGAYPDMSNPATLSDFRLDTYEITVGRFRQFVNAGMGTQASPPPIGAGARTLNQLANQGGWDAAWNTSLSADTGALVTGVKCNTTYAAWTDTPGANEALPMNCITWFDAFAFCVWDGGFLPTEAEWNYAAAGGTEQRAYPWSTPPSSLTIDCSYANHATCVVPPTGGVARVGSTSPRGDGRYDQADLAGNLSEWTLDWYRGGAGTYLVPCTDCADLVDATFRIVRGGDFSAAASVLRGGFRARDSPVNRRPGFGARCARSP